MIKHHHSFIRLLSLVTLVVALSVGPFLPMTAHAAQITNRKLTLIAGDTNGNTVNAGAMASGVVKHKFDFTVPSGTSVGSIQFLYCTQAADTCVTPTGLSTTSATLDAQSGATGFTMVNTTNGAPYIARVSASVIPAATPLSYTLNSVTNPSDNNTSFYVRITTFATTDATGAPTDQGTVAASTSEQIYLSGIMPESLVFCTGATIDRTPAVTGVPDCATATAGVISYNQAFSPTDTATASSQMFASTNAGSGFAITVNGPTLTSGANTITGMSTMGPIIHGVSQFGLNLKANTVATSTVPVGAEIDKPSNGANFRAAPATGYDTVDNFKFVPGDVVANSDNGGAGGTDSQIITVSYIANVPGSLPAGTYSTTLTYICTPTF
ncbi:MAG TPA: hypothetical protein PKC86_00880 [Candidatus Saccharibacteria bacterium]|nr:hypothetical protein [Candidatus Saccharibacteria bacterium]